MYPYLYLTPAPTPSLCLCLPSPLLLLLLLLLASSLPSTHAQDLHSAIPNPASSINSIPFSTRAHWMRAANRAATARARAPCPASAFAAAIVNHTAAGLGALVCVGANAAAETGNPTMHGEIAAIANCTAIMTDPEGPFRFSAAQARAAFADLSLYTNAESCPMCASAIRWSGFREYIYGTSMAALVGHGWDQIRVPSLEVFRQAFDLPTQARLLGGVLTNETDPLFFWQFDPDFPCPEGCARAAGACQPQPQPQPQL